MAHTDTVTVKLSEYNNIMHLLSKIEQSEVVAVKFTHVQYSIHPNVNINRLESENYTYYVKSQELIDEIKAIDSSNKELMKKLVAKVAAQHALITELGKQIEQIRSRSLWQRILNK